MKKKRKFIEEYPSVDTSNILDREEMDEVLGGDCKKGCRENCKEGCSSGGRNSTTTPDPTQAP